MKALNLIYGLLFPPKCVLCGDLLQNGEQDLCKECRSEAHLFPNGKRKLQFLDSFAAVWYYEERSAEVCSGSSFTEGGATRYPTAVFWPWS